MVENTQLKILDELLEYLLTTELNRLEELRNDTIKKSEFLKSVNNFTFNSALKKLSKDGYVIEKYKKIVTQKSNIQKTNTYYYYDISFDSMFFIKNGGYRQEALVAQRKEDEYVLVNAEQKLHASSLLRANEKLAFLTWIIAIGTGIAAIYYLLEILAFFGVCQSEKV